MNNSPIPSNHGDIDASLTGDKILEELFKHLVHKNDSIIEQEIEKFVQRIKSIFQIKQCLNIVESKMDEENSDTIWVYFWDIFTRRHDELIPEGLPKYPIYTVSGNTKAQVFYITQMNSHEILQIMHSSPKLGLRLLNHHIHRKRVTEVSDSCRKIFQHISDCVTTEKHDTHLPHQEIYLLLPTCSAEEIDLIYLKIVLHMLSPELREVICIMFLTLKSHIEEKYAGSISEKI